MADKQDNPELQETQEEPMTGSQATIVDDYEPEVPGGESSGEESGSEPKKKYADIYDSVEALEEGYKNLQREYTRTRQAQTQQEPTKSKSDGSADDRADELQTIKQRMDQMEIERGWLDLEREYGPNIRKDVRDYFEQLPETEQQQLNTLAGARVIAKMLARENPSKGTQSVGAPKSHKAKRSTLTEAQILRMSPDEYRARQGEIMEYYRQRSEAE